MGKLAWIIGEIVKRVIFKSPLRYLLNPVNANEQLVRKESEVMPFMFYPYAHFWKRMPSILQSAQGPDPRKVPTLFLYGRDKNSYFHDEEQMAVLEGTNQVYAGLPGGHWFYYYESRVATLKY